MNHIPFLSICVLTFLPVPVEGTLIFLSQIIFPQRRIDRDCAALLPTTGITNTDSCECFPNVIRFGALPKFDVFISCPSLEENICLSPSDARFCTNSSLVSTSAYRATTTNRRFLLPFITPTINQETMEINIDNDNLRNEFQFFFDSSSPEAYTTCAVFSSSSFPSGEGDSESGYCNSCEICESGVDFQYDCSNVRGTIVSDNVTNSKTTIPGPKVESCIPITNIIASF